MSPGGLALAAGVSGALALLVTPPLARLAGRLGAVSQPGPERYHRQPTPRLGGLALWVGMAGGWLVLAVAGAACPPARVAFGWLMAIGTGFLDDLRPLRPAAKLAGLTLAALLVLSGLESVPLLWWPFWGLWLLIIANGMNLLDNMDGVTLGVAMVAGAAWLGLLPAGAWPAHTGLLLATACAGLLAFNFPPARVFIGDTGSLGLGMILATLPLASLTRPGHPDGTWLLGPLVLVVPIFDLGFVSVTRWLRGAPVMRGGRDHTTHRLAATGVSDVGVAITAPAIGLLAGLVAYWQRESGTDEAALAGLALTIALLAASGVLYRVPRPGTGRSVTAGRLVVLVVDGLLLLLAYWLATILRFESGEARSWAMGVFHRSALLVVSAKLLALALLGHFEEGLSEPGRRRVLRVAQGVALGTLGTVATLVLLTRFESFSRSVFVMDALLAVMVLLSSRFAWAWLHDRLRETRPATALILVCSARDVGLVLRALSADERGLVRGWVGPPEAREQAGLPHLGDTPELERVLDGEPAIRGIITAAWDEAGPGSGWESIYRLAEQRGLRVRQATIRLE